MKTIYRRIRKLEDRISPERPPHLVLQILGECGFLPTNTAGVVGLLDVPDDLSAKELEKYLREHGAETRSLQAKTKD
jgi:hypothetical protein